MSYVKMRNKHGRVVDVPESLVKDMLAYREMTYVNPPAGYDPNAKADKKVAILESNLDEEVGEEEIERALDNKKSQAHIPTCTYIKPSGKKCNAKAVQGTTKCRWHQNVEDEPEEKPAEKAKAETKIKPAKAKRAQTKE